MEDDHFLVKVHSHEDELLFLVITRSILNSIPVAKSSHYLSSNLVVNYTLTLICIMFLLFYDKVSAELWTASLGGEFGLFEPYCRS
jgi:hypothetical protein